MSNASMVAATRSRGVALALSARPSETSARLAELFADPILDLVLRADHVERRDIELLLESVAAARRARFAAINACWGVASDAAS
jgi:hypothetical protein